MGSEAIRTGDGRGGWGMRITVRKVVLLYSGLSTFRNNSQFVLQYESLIHIFCIFTPQIRGNNMGASTLMQADPG